MTDAPDFRVYLVYSGDTPEQDAVSGYVNRYGAQPEKVYQFNRQVWVGPVPDKDEEE